MTDRPITNVIILGGGSAGWIAAGTLAANFVKKEGAGLNVTLIESPDVKPIGVGEGTWPSMRSTLEHIGVSEQQFFAECGASFKQGSKFVSWRNGKADDVYYHPFTLPEAYGQADSYMAWVNSGKEQSFANYVCPQEHVSEAGCAPKQKGTPPWAGVLQYGYHLDAGKFSQMLHKHCVGKLGVIYIQDHVTGIQSHADGDIVSLKTKKNGNIHGDLFIDCTGTKSLLLSEHFNIPFNKQDHILFNDSAIATHVPYVEENSNIPAATVSTAQEFGWIWDIALQNRRGVGYTYSSKYADDQVIEKQLREYVSSSIGSDATAKLQLRKISFTPGYYDKFWHKNCLAIGLSAGFIEPLEASALAMVELSCGMLKEEFPSTRTHMDFVSKRFNERFTYRWERVIEFLKLHYVISERQDSPYWLDHRHSRSVPQRLRDLMTLWQYQSPSRLDFIQNEEVFSSASYQYVLYGMGFVTRKQLSRSSFYSPEFAAQLEQQNIKKKNQFSQGLPSNRDLIDYYCRSYHDGENSLHAGL